MTLLSITEVAERLGVSREAVWQQYRAGKYPNAQRIGKQIAIPNEDIADKPADLPGTELPKGVA